MRIEIEGEDDDIVHTIHMHRAKTDNGGKKNASTNYYNILYLILVA